MSVKRTVVGWIVLVLFCNACGTSPRTIRSTNKTVTAVVTVLEPHGRRTVQITNDAQIKLIEGWLREAKSTQLPLEQLGAVGPWCEVTFYSGFETTSTHEIYAIDGGTTRRKLLTDEQRQRFINIIDGQ